jgi:hypothetical protein
LKGRDLRAATLLKLQHLTAIIVVSSTLAEGGSFVGLTPYFRVVVALTKSLVNAETKEHQSSFIPEMGILPPIYFTAMKCRDPEVRQEAMNILQSTQRREGLWDSTTEWQVAQRVLDLERAGVATAASASDQEGSSQEHNDINDNSIATKLLIEKHLEAEARKAVKPHLDKIVTRGGGLMPWQWKNPEKLGNPSPIVLSDRTVPSSPQSSTTSDSSSSYRKPEAPGLHMRSGSRRDPFSGEDTKLFEYFGMPDPEEWMT